nr:hypothetical protein CFP56_73568 [Quercus suber]
MCVYCKPGMVELSAIRSWLSKAVLSCSARWVCERTHIGIDRIRSQSNADAKEKLAWLRSTDLFAVANDQEMNRRLLDYFTRHVRCGIRGGFDVLNISILNLPILWRNHVKLRRQGATQ